jgi:hypothetical protein
MEAIDSGPISVTGISSRLTGISLARHDNRVSRPWVYREFHLIYIMRIELDVKPGI